MKKVISALLFALLLTGLFSGCDAETPPPADYTNSAYLIFNLDNVDVQDVIDTLPQSDLEPLPDEVLAETDVYTYYRKNGVCYLNFKSGNHRITMDIDEKDSCDHRFTFASMDEAYQWLCHPVFTAHIEEYFRHCWPLDAENGFLMPDPQRLYVCEAPEEYQLESVDFRGVGFALIYKTKELLESRRYGAFVVGSRSSESFTEALKKYYRFDRGTPKQATEISHSIRDDNASVYEYETYELKNRIVHYTLEETTKKVFIEEHYGLPDGNKTREYLLYDATVIACEKGICYSISNHYSNMEEVLKILPHLKLVEYQP